VQTSFVLVQTSFALVQTSFAALVLVRDTACEGQRGEHLRIDDSEF
jgi:hypothetical protein